MKGLQRELRVHPISFVLRCCVHPFHHSLIACCACPLCLHSMLLGWHALCVLMCLHVVCFSWWCASACSLTLAGFSWPAGVVCPTHSVMTVCAGCQPQSLVHVISQAKGLSGSGRQVQRTFTEKQQQSHIVDSPSQVKLSG